MYKVVIDKCDCDGRYTHQEILYYNNKERAYNRANEESNDIYTTLFVRIEELQIEE